MSETQRKVLAVALNFSLKLAQRVPLSTAICSPSLKEKQPLVVRPLEKSFFAALVSAMPKKGKIEIQSAFDVDYNSVFEHVVYVSDSTDKRIKIPGKTFLQNLVNLLI